MRTTTRRNCRRRKAPRGKKKVHGKKVHKSKKTTNSKKGGNPAKKPKEKNKSMLSEASEDCVDGSESEQMLVVEEFGGIQKPTLQ